MVQSPDFRYYLTYNSQRTEVIFAPKSWEENSSISYKRDDEYFGMIRSWALPLDFVEDGAKILRRAYYQDGVEAGVIFEVEEFNHATYAYEPGFKGDIDFSKVQDEHNVFSVTLMQSGPSSRIKAYENVKYEYVLKGDDVVNMILPGVPFAETAQFIITPSTGSLTRYMPELSLVTGSFQSGFVTSQSTLFQAANDTSFSGSENWFIKAERNMDVFIKGKIKGGYFIIFGAAGFTITIKDQTNATIRTLRSQSSSGDGTYEFDFEETISMYSGQKLFLYFRTNSASAQNTLSISEATDIVASYNSVSDPSSCKGIKSADMFKRIINRIAPGAQTASYLLANTWANLMFTSGNAIREITDAKIKISLKEFFQTANGIDDAAMGTESDVLRLETKNYFARNAESVNVGKIGDDSCTIEPATDFMASKISVGYDDKNTEDKDGLKEYNSGQQWELPIARVQNELNFVSVARADQYGIEKLRVKFNVLNEDGTRGTDDTPSDNDTFMVDCYQDGAVYRPILGSSYESVTGLANESAANLAYNLRITPKKNLLRHGAYLRSIMHRMDQRYINFASAEKNADLKTIKAGVGVKENENILVASLPDGFFIPVTTTIRCKLPYGAQRLIDSVPFGYVTFNWKGVTLKGYILELTIDIAKNTEQELKLLLTNDNNLLNLIR